MNIRRYIRFLRPGKPLSWQRGKLLPDDPEQHSRDKIIEYQDRWTVSPSRPQFWLNDGDSHNGSGAAPR